MFAEILESRKWRASSGVTRVTWIVPMLVCLLSIFSLSACKNAFSDLADTTTDDALVYQAQEQINSSDYDAAIATINTMTPAGLAAHSTQGLLASAYAGSCGLNLLGLSTVLQNIGTNTLFLALLTEYRAGVAANVMSCQSAETILSGLANRTSDENLLLAFTELVKIGRVLSIDADTNQDGVVDGGYNACTLNTADATAIGLGITTFITAIQASGVSVAGSVVSALTPACNAIETAIQVSTGNPSYSGFCSKTTFTSTELQMFRSLTTSDEIGLKTCANTVDQCICP